MMTSHFSRSYTVEFTAILDGQERPFRVSGILHVRGLRLEIEGACVVCALTGERVERLQESPAFWETIGYEALIYGAYEEVSEEPPKETPSALVWNMGVGEA